ncbi:MAG: GAF domain-containing protein [Gammaproteobacteria bacterium]|nr:GAF domain-containing protein [Gammaproteobacteria bacterium]
MDPLKIIVAESNQEKENSLASKLIQQRNWQILTADKVESALKLAQVEKPDVVVLQGKLLGGALNFLVRLRSSIGTAFIPVLAVCGNVGPQQKELLKTGAQECLQQPVKSRELCALIKQLVEEPLVITEAPEGSVNDPQRMAALEQSQLLDSSPGDQFDLLTNLTAKILGVPVALVSLVDKDRQFFKSQYGLPEPWSISRETPLTHSFCQWVVTGKEQLVVEDAREDPVLRDNLAIHDLGVIAYAGLPITAGDNQIIGSFCAIDSHPRSWTFDELACLRDLSHITEACIAFEQEIFGWLESAPAIDRKQQAEISAAIFLAAKGIAATTRLLRRSGLDLNDEERNKLLDIVETLSQNQVKLSQ